jgi:hypothetical protein
MDSFVQNYEIIHLDADQILKAMEAGTATDIVGLTGHDAIRKQSIEGGSKGAIAKIVKAIIGKTIQPTAKAVKAYLRDMGLSDEETQAIYKSYQQTVRSGAKDILKIA